MAACRTIGVVGSGAMGSGIAQSALAAGLDVILFDLDQTALQGAGAAIVDRLAQMAAKGRVPQHIADSATRRLTLATSIEDFAPADIVIEAIVERLDAKKALLQSLESVVRADTILATNTSSLSVAAITAQCSDRTRACGLHFFNPVPLMKLVEVIATPDTAPDVIERATAFASALGKTPVTVRDMPGFLVNLAGRAYTTEALHILWEGVADVATIDRVLRDGAGFRMGPFELMDLTGIDVNFPATTAIYSGFQNDPRLKTTPLHEAMFRAGHFGRKTGRGFYDYSAVAEDAGAPIPPASPSEPFGAVVAQDAPGFARLRADAALFDDDNGPLLIAPIGEDATTVCHHLNLPPARTVAIDFTAMDRRHLTLMSAVEGSSSIKQVAEWLRGHGFTVEIIGDSPGFVLQRVIAMIANLSADIAQAGIATPDDIDMAMKLAQNYPRGPIEWIGHLGASTIHRIMTELQAISGSDRYRPSLWLRRRALMEQMADRRGDPELYATDRA